ncbi:MAG: glycosyltransferase [Leeuwenhoekiella sp.]
MKLAIVTAFPPSKVTLNEYGYYLVKHFCAREEVTELILITDKTVKPKTLDFDQAGKISIQSCWNFNGMSTVPNVLKAINATKPDAVLYNLQFLKFGDRKIAAGLGLMLPLLTRLKGVPTISLLHNILEQVDLANAGMTNNKLLQRVYNLTGTVLTRAVLASDKVAVTINKYVTILEKKYKMNNVELIPHGSFETPPEPDYSLPQGPKQIMAFGKFGTYKKVELLIEAVEELRKKGMQDLSIVIAGTDSPNTPGYLENVSKKYSEVEDLHFTGYVAEEDVPRLFNDSAVVVFPYTSTTGSSGVLHQAGSYGKAVALPNLGDLKNLVEEEGYIGEFFDPYSSSSLADAIGSILENEEYRIAIGKQNFRAAASLPMDVITGMYIEQFKKIQRKKGKTVSNKEDIAIDWDLVHQPVVSHFDKRD